VHRDRFGVVVDRDRGRHAERQLDPARCAAAAGDRRAVSADRGARYFGAALEKGSLVPEDAAAARLGSTRFATWLATV
jgi:hypothetical protein